VAQRAKFTVPVGDLERAVRVNREDLVESVDTAVESTDDPRGPEPDRGWFASGG
jgi:hypothetical protein